MLLKYVAMALLAACLLAANAWAADAPIVPPATQSAPTATAAAPTSASTQAARTEDQLKDDLHDAMDQAQSAIKNPKNWADAGARAKFAPTVIPALQNAMNILEQLRQSIPRGAELTRDLRYQTLAFLTLLGDAEASKMLDAAATGTDADEALSAKTARELAAWLKASQDAAAQGKVLDNMQALAKANPTSEAVAEMLWIMSQLGPVNKDMTKRAIAIVSTDLKGKASEGILARVAQMKEAEAAEAKLKELEGQPLVIAGKTPEDKAFTTADWKGKVVLIDFWATWCPPCRAELPRVKKMYQQYHAKGLEVLGVSNDQTADALTGFTKDDGEMPWPQLFDAAAAAHGQWNSNTTRFGIDSIPVMFLIDRNGVLRSVDARDNFEEQIPKLLEEKPGAAPATATATEPATQK